MAAKARVVATAALATAAFAASAASVAAQDAGSCRFHFPPKTTTIAYTAYGGGLKSDVKIRDEPHQIRRIEVHVPRREEAIFVVLSAYDPVEWNLRIESGAQIVGVFAMGYHNQTISNLPALTPYGISSFRSGVGYDCPRYSSNSDGQGLRGLISNEFGKSINETYSGSGPKCLYKDCTPSQAPAAGIWSWFAKQPKAEPAPSNAVIVSSGQLIR